MSAAAGVTELLRHLSHLRAPFVPRERLRGGVLGLSSVLALALLAVVSGAAARPMAGPGGGLVKQKVGAYFVYLELGLVKSVGNCSWTVGIVFGNASGAGEYMIQFNDPFQGGPVNKVITPAEFQDSLIPKSNLPGGSHFLAVTGGAYSPPCGRMNFAGERQRFQKGAQAWGLFSPGYKPRPAPLGIDWTMPMRLTPGTPAIQRWDTSDGLPPISDIYPKSWQVDLLLTSGGAPACPSGKTYVWTVTGGGKSQTLPSRTCKVTATVPKLGDYSVTAKEFKGGKATGAVAANPNVKVQDFLIVGLGDSNGSGEGNPPFYYPRCNRSVASYQFQAALYVELQDRHSSVTFIHASCSGARIDHLYTTPYEGTRAASPALDPQIWQVSHLLAQGTPARKVDAMIMSAGVNDIAFGPILTFCVLEGVISPHTPCEGTAAAPSFDNANPKRITGFVALHGVTSSPTLGSRLGVLQKQLPSRYAPLAAALQQPVNPKHGGLAVKNPADVYITQYPDFTNDDNGTPCGPSGLARFDTSTWTWLGLNASLLNRTVAAAARASGWTLVPVNSLAFAKRGYCATHSLFHGIGGPAVGLGASGAPTGTTDTAGPFHPDAEAHLIQAAEVEPLLCKELSLSATCK